MSNLAKNPVIMNDELEEEWASSVFSPPKHRFLKMPPSLKKQKLDDAMKLESTPPRNFRDDDIAIKLSLSQDDNNIVDSWNYSRASPKSFQEGLFPSGTFDFSLPATPPRAAAADHSDVELASPPDIRKQLSPTGFSSYPDGEIQQFITTMSPKYTMFQGIQGRIKHLSPDKTLYNVASNSDDGFSYRPCAWSFQDEQADADEDKMFHLSPPPFEIRKSRVSNSTKQVSEPITPSQAHIYQTVSNETSSPAMLHPNKHDDLKTADFTPDTKFSTPTAVTNDVSYNNSIQYNTPSTWYRAPLPPLMSQEGESTEPHLLPRPPQSTRQASFRVWDPQNVHGCALQSLSPINSGYNQGAVHSFHPDVAPSSIIDSDHIWSRNHDLLRMFQSRFGHCNVPKGYGLGSEYESLHGWCKEQRVEYEKMCRGESTTMTPTRMNILMELGFTGNSSNIKMKTSSDSSRETWSRWIAKLTEYRAEHGNVDVPLKYEPCPSLGTFVNRQRTELKKMEAGKASSMTPARIQDLNRLGFTWTLRESHVSWEYRYNELKQFNDTHGHCNVPKMYPPNQALGYWVNEQRSQYRRFVENKPSYITEDKVRALKEIGFKWSIRKSNTCSSNWDNWLKQLKAYKDEHGDTDVPLKYPKNIALGAFVNRQRTEYRKVQQGVHSSLTEKRINSLNELGFKWQLRVSRTPWEQRLEELREFKEEFGHCNVPSSWSKNQPLAYWVFKQRGQYRLFHENIVNGNSNNRCNMTEDRIAQLEELGFEWNPPRKSKFHSEQNESATF